MNRGKYTVNPTIVGNPAEKIAELAGISVPKGIKILIVELKGAGPEYPLSREKLSPVLAMMKSNNAEHAFELYETMLNLSGLGYTVVIHTEDEELQVAFDLRMKACRILVNTSSAKGGIGNIYNGVIPSLTLGCGSYGKGPVSKNVSAISLINIKMVAERRNNMQWFKLPPKIFFEENSL